MKKLLCCFLVLCLTASMFPIAATASENDIEICSLNVAFEDNPTKHEALSVATNGTNVWVNAKQLYERLGYSVDYSEAKNAIIIYNTQRENIPTAITVFHCDSNDVSYLYYDTFTIKQYSAPFYSFADENGWWVPFEYSLLLNRSYLHIQGDTIKIAMPQKNLADIFYELTGKYDEFVFDWCEDFGYETEESFLWLNQYEWMYSANYLALLLDGILTFEGSAYLTFVSQFFGESTGFDVKYGNALVRLLCIDSDQEYMETVEHAKNSSDVFLSDGQLGELLTDISDKYEQGLGSLSARCDALKKRISDDNPITVLQYNREYQRLEDMLAQQSQFEATGGSILELQNHLSSALPQAEAALKAMELIGYAADFARQDGYAVSALGRYLTTLPDDQKLFAMNLAMEEELYKLQSNFLEYSVYTYLVNNWKEVLGVDKAISKALGTRANVMLFAWSLASNWIPFISDGLDSADQFMVGTYAGAIQHYAFNQYWESKQRISTEASDEDFVKCAQSCYIYLKSCYVAREAAVASLCNAVDDIENSTEPLIVQNRQINSEIAKYLALLKAVPNDNKSAAFGFLRANNEEYLAKYDDSKLLTVIKRIDNNPSDTTINQYGRFLLTEAPYADHTDLFQVYQYPIDGYIYYKNNPDSISTSIVTNVPSSIPLIEVETADYAHDGNPYRFTIETVLIDGVGGEHPTLCMQFFGDYIEYTNADSSLSLYSDNESYFYIIDRPENAYLVQESIEYKNIETAGILYQYKPSESKAIITESIKITNLKTLDYYVLSAVFDPTAGMYKYYEDFFSSREGFDGRTLYYEYPETNEFGGEMGTRQGLVAYVQATLEKYGLADRVFSDQSTLSEVKNVLCTQVIGDAKDYNLKTDEDLSITGTLWMGYPLGIDISGAPVDMQPPATEGFAGNQTAEQLRKSIVGSWGREGAIVSDYDFISDGTCYWSFEKQIGGTYKIRDDKMLLITFPWMDDRYFWTEETYEEWRSHSSDDCWYMTDSGVLVLNGVSYYRDGKVIKDYNTEGGLLATIAGSWVLDDFTEYRFFMDGTYEENMVSVSYGILFSRVDIDAGPIEIVDDTHAKLWHEADSFGEIPYYTELVYDPETDTLRIGGSNNVYHRAEYSD